MIAVGVADRLEGLLAEVLQDADQEEADGVPSQVGRDEAQANAGRRGAGTRSCRRRGPVEGCGVPAVEFGMGLGQ